MKKIKKSKISLKESKKDLPYPCQQVFELYATSMEDVDKLESLQKSLKKLKIISEMYYTNHSEISYATLVVFLPWSFHGEISEFNVKAYQKWH
jgi:hypothetical protein